MSDYLNRLREVIAASNPNWVSEAATIIRQVRKLGGDIYIAGNGGSSATASHFAQDLAKQCSLRTMCLSDSQAKVTAYGNDDGFQWVFANQVSPWLDTRDLVIVFSGSGNSQDILRLLELSNSRGARSIAFGGTLGGAMKPLAHTIFCIPSTRMEIIEDVHSALTHAIISELVCNP